MWGENEKKFGFLIINRTIIFPLTYMYSNRRDSLSGDF